jgi:hypothetical protein
LSCSESFCHKEAPPSLIARAYQGLKELESADAKELCQDETNNHHERVETNNDHIELLQTRFIPELLFSPESHKVHENQQAKQ